MTDDAVGALRLEKTGEGMGSIEVSAWNILGPNEPYDRSCTVMVRGIFDPTGPVFDLRTFVRPEYASAHVGLSIGEARLILDVHTRLERALTKLALKAGEARTIEEMAYRMLVHYFGPEAAIKVTAPDRADDARDVYVRDIEEIITTFVSRTQNSLTRSP